MIFAAGRSHHVFGPRIRRTARDAVDITQFAAAGMAGAEQSVLPGEAAAEMHRRVVGVSGLLRFAADGYGLGHFTERLSDGCQGAGIVGRGTAE